MPRKVGNRYSFYERSSKKVGTKRKKQWNFLGFDIDKLREELINTNSTQIGESRD